MIEQDEIIYIAHGQGDHRYFVLFEVYNDIYIKLLYTDNYFKYNSLLQEFDNILLDLKVLHDHNNYVLTNNEIRMKILTRVEILNLISKYNRIKNINTIINE